MVHMKRGALNQLWRRAWMVFCDHSFVVARRTKREAEETVRLRQSQPISNVEHHIAGPYVLDPDATVLARPPEWISRCACGVTYRLEKEWSALESVGVMSDGAGGALQLRNCVACGSTISRRISLKKGALKRGRR